MGFWEYWMCWIGNIGRGEWGRWWDAPFFDEYRWDIHTWDDMGFPGISTVLPKGVVILPERINLKGMWYSG